MHAAPRLPASLLARPLCLSASFSALSRLSYGLPFACLPHAFALCPTDKWTAPVRLSRSQRSVRGCPVTGCGPGRWKVNSNDNKHGATTESRARSGGSYKGASSVDKWTAAGRQEAGGEQAGSRQLSCQISATTAYPVANLKLSLRLFNCTKHTPPALLTGYCRCERHCDKVAECGRGEVAINSSRRLGNVAVVVVVVVVV